jgi:predicted O-linked N-acetylglucosamine transferase (SPINDLY family)
MPKKFTKMPRAMKSSAAILQVKFEKAVLLQRQEMLSAAERIYEEILMHQPSHYDALLLLGVIAFQTKRKERAIEFYRRAIGVNENIADAHSNLGMVLLSLNRPEEALSSFDRSIALKPNWIGEDYDHRGNALLKLNRHSEALSSFDQAIALKPNFANAFSNRGNALMALHRSKEAIVSYDMAIALKPDVAEAWIGRGNCFNNMKRYDDALVAYDRAISLRSDFAEAWSGRSSAYKATGRFKEAVSSFEKALRLTTPNSQKDFDNIIALGSAIYSLDCIPAVYRDEIEIKTSRLRFSEAIKQINDEINKIDRDDTFVWPQSILDAAFQVAGFYVSYQQENDRELMQSYSNVLRKILRIKDRPRAAAARRSNKIRFGIASQLLRNHPGARYAYQWISNLPSEDYEFFSYAFHGDEDEVTLKLEKLGTFRRLPFELSSFHHTINLMKADNLDILMLPDIGMSVSSRILSQYRIAPIQITSWGHPVTSGSPNIDFFLSSELMETRDADESYTEKLIRLPNTSRFIEGDSIVFDDNATFDLPGDRILYGCLQSLFKLLPQFDVVYPRIAKRVPNACFIFIEGDPSYITKIMKDRLIGAFEKEGLNADKYVRFLPRMNAKRYASLYKAIHINIDPVGWSGGYTTIECLEANCPVVTLPTQHMRGRHSYAILKMLGVDELIASSLETFIDKLSQLGTDSYWRHSMTQKIAQNKYRMYEDWMVIKVFDEFLKAEFSKLSL